MPACEWVAQSIEVHHKPNLSVKHPIPRDKTAPEICRRSHWWTTFRKTGDVLRSTSIHKMLFHINDNLLRPSQGFWQQKTLKKKKSSDLFERLLGIIIRQLFTVITLFFLSMRLQCGGNRACSPDSPHTAPAPAVSQQRTTTCFPWYLTTHFFFLPAVRFLHSLRGTGWWSYVFLKTTQGLTNTNWVSVRFGGVIKNSICCTAKKDQWYIYK